MRGEGVNPEGVLPVFTAQVNWPGGSGGRQEYDGDQYASKSQTVNPVLFHGVSHSGVNNNRRGARNAPDRLARMRGDSFTCRSLVSTETAGTGTISQCERLNDSGVSRECGCNTFKLSGNSSAVPALSVQPEDFVSQCRTGGWRRPHPTRTHSMPSKAPNFCSLVEMWPIPTAQ